MSSFCWFMLDFCNHLVELNLCLFLQSTRIQICLHPINNHHFYIIFDNPFWMYGKIQIKRFVAASPTLQLLVSCFSDFSPEKRLKVPPSDFTQSIKVYSNLIQVCNQKSISVPAQAFFTKLFQAQIILAMKSTFILALYCMLSNDNCCLFVNCLITS